MNKEVNYPEDHCWALTSKEDAVLFVLEIGDGVKTFPNSNFLALGSGHAEAELEIAREFGFSDITLVDKAPRKIFIVEGLDVKYLKSDMFVFLDNQKNQDKKYGLVTLIGLDYLFEYDSENWNKLWDGLREIMEDEGVVYVFGVSSEEWEIPNDEFDLLPNYGFLAIRKSR